VTIFDPVKYSNEENKFLLDNLGKPPVVALRSLPTNVNRAAVKPVIDRIYELVELEKHAGLAWCGADAIKESINVWLTESEKWANDRRRNRPRFPSLYSFDQKGRAHRYGPGSDSGHVRTYFGKDGQRHVFAVQFVPDGVTEYIPEWQADIPKDGLVVSTEFNRIECFCGHTERYNPDSRGSFNSARARMSKHLRSATEEVDRHREIHTNEFGGA
jgi:hypothetical protein